METNNSIEIPNKRYFTIGEVSKITHIKTHILRYWEKEFEVLEPIKRKGNRRYYTQNDILTILKINDLISSHGFTIEGAKQKLHSTSNLIQHFIFTPPHRSRTCSRTHPTCVS